MYPELPQKLCKIWVGSLIWLRTISTLSREQRRRVKNKNIQAQPKITSFYLRCAWNNQYFSLLELFFFSVCSQVVEKFWSLQLQQLWEGIYFLLLCEQAWLFVSYSWLGAWHCDMIDHKFYHCTCYYYHLIFVIIIKLFRQKKFRFCVNNKFANDFFFSVFKLWLFWWLLR